MPSLEKAAYIGASALGFVCALLATLGVRSVPTQEIPSLTGVSSFLIAAAMGGCALLSGVTAYLVARSVRHCSAWVLFIVRLFFYTLPATAGGMALSAILELLGLVDVTWSASYLGLLAMSDLSAGVAGIATMKSIPEFRRFRGGKEVGCR